MVTSSNAKSNFFGAGENSPPNGARKYCTLVIPSFFAMACESAYSNPEGFLIVVPVARPFQNDGAGRSKPTMSFPGFFVGTARGLAPAAAVTARATMPAATRTRFIAPPSVSIPDRTNLARSGPPGRIRRRLSALSMIPIRADRPARGRPLEPGQALLSGAGAHEGRPRPVLPRRRGLCPAASAKPALPHGAVSERRRGRFLPPEAGARPSGLRRRAVRQVPERPFDGLRSHRQPARTGLGDQPGVHRAAHLALARPGDREARLSAHRPRSVAGGAMAVRAGDRPRRPRGDGGAWARRVPEDVGGHRPAHHGADQAGAELSRRAPLREGPRRGGGAADRRPGGRDHDVARRRTPWRFCRLRPELARQDDCVCVLGAPDA